MRHADAMNSSPNVDPVCYWVLLTSTLQFCYTSPSFTAAVPEAKRIIGRRFTDYLNNHTTNPDSVADRLRASYFDQEEKGSVFVIEYANVSAIRHHLQTNQWFPDPAYSFAQYSLVVSRAGGFILAFIHVKTEVAIDCNFHLCEPLKPGDLSSVQQYLPSLEPQPPYHVFQILSNDDRRPIIFSTPTTLAGRLTIVPAQLAEGTQNPRDSALNQGHTSCTKRTRITFAINTLEGQLLSVQSIILRHGSALLVMYRLTPLVPPSPQPVSPAMSLRFNPPPGTPYQTQNPHEYRRLSAASEGFTQPSPVQQQQQQPGPMSQSPYDQGFGSDQLQHRNSYDSNYPPTSPEDTRSVLSSPLSAASLRNHHRTQGIPMRRYSATERGTTSTTGQESLSPMGSLEEHEVMSHTSMHSPTDPAFIMDHGHRLSTSSTMTDPAINDVNANALRGRPAKDPPKGVICCRICSTRVTPEWRKGPSGVKDMCNACGLRWNRRLKKMKGDGTNVGDNSIESLPPGIDPDTLLEPQRSGGGSKKGHRKKATESRGPALTTKPAKRRNSDVMIGAAGGVSPFSATSPLDIKYHHHPHNPHYSQGATPNTSRPALPPLFDDQTPYSPPTGQPMSMMSTSSSSSQGMNYHAQSLHTNHRMKPGTSPDSPHGFHNNINNNNSGIAGPGPGAVPGGASAAASSSASAADNHGTTFSPGPYSAAVPHPPPPPNGNPYTNHNHLGQPQPQQPSDRPVLQMPGASPSYNSSQEMRGEHHPPHPHPHQHHHHHHSHSHSHHSQHSPQFERRGADGSGNGHGHGHGPSGSNVYSR